MLKPLDRVRETTTTTGTSDFVCGGADTGYIAFGTGYADGDRFDYVAALGAQWEVGLGEYDSGSNSVLRIKCHASSNAGAFVSFGAGAKKLWVDHPAIRDAFRKPSKVLISERFI